MSEWGSKSFWKIIINLFQQRISDFMKTVSFISLAISAHPNLVMINARNIQRRFGKSMWWLWSLLKLIDFFSLICFWRFQESLVCSKKFKFLGQKQRRFNEKIFQRVIEFVKFVYILSTSHVVPIVVVLFVSSVSFLLFLIEPLFFGTDVRARNEKKKHFCV